MCNTYTFDQFEDVAINHEHNITMCERWLGTFTRKVSETFKANYFKRRYDDSNKLICKSQRVYNELCTESKRKRPKSCLLQYRQHALACNRKWRLTFDSRQERAGGYWWARAVSGGCGRVLVATVENRWVQTGRGGCGGRPLFADRDSRV